MSKRAGVRRLGIPFWVAFAVAMTLVLSFGSPAYAAACTTTAATGAALVSDVNGGAAGDVICLNAGVNYATSSIAMDVKHNLTIQTDPAQIASGGKAATINGGSQTGTSTIDGGQLDLFAVAAGDTLTMSNVILTGTLQPSNGAIYLSASPPAGGNGGMLVMDHSLISSNSSNGVDSDVGSTATITNSTITQSNGASGIQDDGTVNLNEDTIAFSSQYGINNHGGGTANVFNTILAGNTIGNCFFAITPPTTGSGSNSDDSGTTCGTTITTGGNQGTGNGVITGTSPALNGGPSPTYALPASSVAIGKGTAAGAATTDQRGFLRDATPDVGAYEFNGSPPATLIVIKHVVGPGSPSAFTMTVTGASASPSSFPGADTPGTAVSVASGQTYQVGESGPTANYTSSQSGNCTGPIAAGATGTCTVTNTAKPTQLTVIKHVVNTGCASGCGAASDFTMTVKDTTTNTTVASFPGAESPGTVNPVTAGDTYSVTEVADAAQSGKYTESDSATCTGTATAGGAITCTITNTYIQCTQPPNAGQQPTPGAPGSSANTCVNTNIAGTILVTAPVSLNTGTLAVGQSSPALSAPVTVFSNDPNGYQLTVSRTAFFSPTDIPINISSGAVSAPQAFLAPFTGAAAPIPTSGPALNLGTSNMYTPAGGDAWPFSMVVGPVPFGIPAGAHQSVVTFTAIGI
jgi:hypothetical protein